MKDLEKKVFRAMYGFHLQNLKYCVYQKFEGMEYHVVAGFADLNTAIHFTENYIEKQISKDYRKNFRMLVMSETQIFLKGNYP